MFSVEKSNPVQNAKLPKIELDNTSLSSESDDFADIHDNPLFRPKKVSFLLRFFYFAK